MAKSNKLLFDFFKNKGLDENSYVYSSDIEKLKEEFDDGDGKFSKRELRKMGLDIKRSEVKSVNRTLQAIEAGEQSGSFDMNAEAQCTAALDAMANLIAGEKIEEKEIYVDPLLVTKDNLEEYRASHSDNY